MHKPFPDRFAFNRRFVPIAVLTGWTFDRLKKGDVTRF